MIDEPIIGVFLCVDLIFQTPAGDDGSTVKIVPPPEQLIPKSLATEGLLAHIAVSKFADALPLYRQQKIFKRLGVDLSRATLANWMIQTAERCRPVIGLLHQEIRSGPLINIDESPLQVLKEPGRSNTAKSFMWVFCGGPPARPAVLYQYHPTRSGQAALGLLDGYRGYVQSDGYSGYDHLTGRPGIVHWTKIRLIFFSKREAERIETSTISLRIPCF
jgi:transposase